MGLSRAVSVETIALLILGRIGEGRFSVGHAALGHIRVGIIGVRHHRPGPMPRPAHPARSQLEFAGTCFAGTRVNSADHAAARCSPKCDRLSVADSLSPTAVELAGMPPQKTNLRRPVRRQGILKTCGQPQPTALAEQHLPAPAPHVTDDREILRSLGTSPQQGETLPRG